MIGGGSHPVRDLHTARRVIRSVPEPARAWPTLQAVHLLVALALAATAPAAAATDGPVVAVPAVAAPVGPSDDARATAATAAGITSFVGLALGGVVVPGGLAALGNYLIGPASQDALSVAGVAGGAAGALIGASIGAATTTVWWGVPLVGLAAAGGSLVGLVPAALLNREATLVADPDPNTPLRLAAASSIVVAFLAGPLSAAGTAALLASPPDEDDR